MAGPIIDCHTHPLVHESQRVQPFDMGVDRVLFGSDYPVVDPGGALEAVAALGFTAEEQRAILYGNAAELLAG
jgi:predicted TIM-barrel fold metal-dependent hydrolase